MDFQNLRFESAVNKAGSLLLATILHVLSAQMQPKVVVFSSLNRYLREIYEDRYFVKGQEH
jgi:hypothetical protein